MQCINPFREFICNLERGKDKRNNKGKNAKVMEGEVSQRSILKYAYKQKPKEMLVRGIQKLLDSRPGI